MATPPERGNDFAVEALKQVLTLASLILGLTVTFIKDALGEHRNLAVNVWLVPWAWFFLAVSIWIAFVSIAHAARLVGGSQQEVYVFRAGKLRHMARIAQWSFALGLSGLASFGISNADVILSRSSLAASHATHTAATEQRPMAPCPPAEQPDREVYKVLSDHHIPVRYIVPFDFNRDRPTNNERDALIRAVSAWPRGTRVVVFGHTDSIGRRTTNVGLSRYRAQAVEELLQGTNATIVMRPFALGQEFSTGAATGDRRVEIYFESDLAAHQKASAETTAQSP